MVIKNGIAPNRNFPLKCIAFSTNNTDTVKNYIVAITKMNITILKTSSKL